MSEFEFRTTADVDEFAQAIWENVGNGVDEKIEDQAWDAVSRQVADAISMDAWDAVSDGVYDAAREAAEEYNNNSDDVESVVSELLRQYNDISVGNHCTIGERATELVTKVIQWHLDASFEDGGLLSSQVVVNADEVEAQIQGANEGLQRVTVLESKVEALADAASLWAETRRVIELEAKVVELTGMVSRLEATTAGLRAKHDTPEATLAHAESTLKHVLIAVQDARGHAVNSGEPF